MKFLLIFIIIIQYENSIFCQDNQIKVPITHTVNVDSMFVPSTRTMKKVLDNRDYKLPTTDLESIIIFESKLNYTQIFFENIKNGEINDSLASQIIKIRNLENINFSNFNNDDKIAILIAKTNNTKIVVIPDYNNNNNFNDDIGYLYIDNVSSDYLLKIPVVKFDNLDYSFGDNGPNESYSITFDITVNYDASSIEKSTISLLSRDIWIGQFELNDLKIEFYIYPIQIPKQTRSFGESQIIYGNIYSIKDFKNSEKTSFNQSIDTFFTKNYGIVLDSVNNSGQYAYFTIKKINETVYLDSIINKLNGLNLKTSAIEKLVSTEKKSFWIFGQPGVDLVLFNTNYYTKCIIIKTLAILLP